MAKSKIDNINELVDSTAFPTMEEVAAKKKAAKAKVKEKPVVAEHVKVAIPTKMPVKSQVTPTEKREKLPANAVAPSSDVLSHLKEKRAKEKEAEHRASQVVAAKSFGDVLTPARVSDLEARIVVLEHRANNPIYKAS